jgi:hypothetical protein
MVGGFEVSRAEFAVWFLVAYLGVCIVVAFSGGTAPALEHKDARAFYKGSSFMFSFQSSALRPRFSAWVDNLYGL